MWRKMYDAASHGSRYETQPNDFTKAPMLAKYIFTVVIFT